MHVWSAMYVKGNSEKQKLLLKFQNTDQWLVTDCQGEETEKGSTVNCHHSSDHIKELVCEEEDKRHLTSLHTKELIRRGVNVVSLGPKGGDCGN